MARALAPSSVGNPAGPRQRWRAQSTRAPPRPRSRAKAAVDDDGQFAPISLESDEGIGGTSDERFGPDVLLLAGFMKEELAQVRALLVELEAEDILTIKLLTREMHAGTLGEAFETEQPSPEETSPALGVPRVCVLSGLTGAEAMAVIDAFGTSDIVPPIFAAAVPNNWNKSCASLLEEIADDHMRLSEAPMPA